MTRVAIAAPTPVVRAGLRAMLQSGEIEVEGEATSVAEALDRFPDVEVVVAMGPGMDATAFAGGDGPVPALVILAGDERPLSALRQMPVNGWGIVSPDAPASELQAAVHAAAQGLVVFSLSSARAALGGRGSLQTLDGPRGDEPLTAREGEVLELLSRGLSNKLIARKLQISEHTVKFHVSSIYSKLGAASRTEAVSIGARQGLITL